MRPNCIPSKGPRLRAFIEGACLRWDRDALRAAMRSVAAGAGITEQRALAALVDWFFQLHSEADDVQIPVDDLERLPAETLELLTFQAVRLGYSSRAIS